MINVLARTLVLPVFFSLLTTPFSVFSKENGEPAQAFFGVSDGRDQTHPHNDSVFYEGKERGWFWYEDPASEEPEEDIALPALPVQKKVDPETVPVPEPTKQDTKPLSAEWFRKNMEKYRDKAIDEPTPQNVSAYMYLQRVMLDKAEKFTEVSQQVVMSDPVLDENSRRPVATFGAFAMDDKATQGTEKAAKQLAKSAGLWFFYSSTCSFCAKEAGVLKGLMNAYDFKVVPIALDGLPLPGGEFSDFTIDRGQAKKMGVESTPALFLVKPRQGSGGVLQIGQGLLSGDEIVKRAITLSHQNGWLNEEDYKETLKVKPLQVDNQTIQHIDDSVMNNPDELVRTIRNNLRKQF